MTPRRSEPLPYDGTGGARLHWAKSARLPAGVTPTWCGIDAADWELTARFADVTCGRCQWLGAAGRQADPENGVMAL